MASIRPDVAHGTMKESKTRFGRLRMFYMLIIVLFTDFGCLHLASATGSCRKLAMGTVCKPGVHRPCIPSSVPGYECSLPLSNIRDKYIIHWAVTTNWLDVAVEAETSGWFGVGWQPLYPNHHMESNILATDVVGGWIEDGKGMTATYQLVQREESPAMVVPFYSSTVSNTNVEQRGSVKLLRFRKEYGPRGCQPLPIAASGVGSLIWAFSPSTAFDNVKIGHFSVDFAVPSAQSTGRSIRPSVSMGQSRVQRRRELLQATDGGVVATPAPSQGIGGEGAASPAAPSPAPSPTSTGCNPSTLNGFTCSFSMGNNGYTLHWAVKSPSSVAFALQTQQSSGWFSIGWSSTGGMLGSDAVIIHQAGANGELGIHFYSLVSKNAGSPQSAVRDLGMAALTGNARVESNPANGTIIARFERHEGDGGKVGFAVRGSSKLIWAMSGDGSKALDYHGDSKGAFVLDFSSGTPPQVLAAEQTPRGYYVAHGWLMWIGFGVFLPLGVFTARFGKSKLTNSVLSKALWFWVHGICQVLGFATITVAGIISLARFEALDTLHGQFGLAIIILVWIQIPFAFLRPQPGTTFRPLWFVAHWTIGTTAIIFAWINIYLGLQLYRLVLAGSVQVWYVLWGIQVAIVSYIYLLWTQWPRIREQGVDADSLTPPQPPSSNHRENGLKL